MCWRGFLFLVARNPVIILYSDAQGCIEAQREYLNFFPWYIDIKKSREQAIFDKVYTNYTFLMYYLTYLVVYINCVVLEWMLSI